MASRCDLPRSRALAGPSGVDVANVLVCIRDSHPDSELRQHRINLGLRFQRPVISAQDLESTIPLEVRTQDLESTIPPTPLNDTLG